MGYKCLSCGNEDRFTASTAYRAYGDADVLIDADGSILDEIDTFADDTEYDYNFDEFDIRCVRCNSCNIGDSSEEVEPPKPKKLSDLLEESK